MTMTVPNPSWGDDESDRLGYDGSGRMITKRYLAGGIDGGTGAYNNPASVVGFTTSFDKASNKLYERHLHAESRSHLYQPYAGDHPQGGYDSADRLRQYQRGILSSTGGLGNAGGGSVTTPISLPNAKTQQNYTLDGLGNWKNTAFTPVGDSQIIQRRDHNHLNQITATKDDSDPKTPFTYDGVTGASNGNLKNDGERGYLYDAFNRLVRVDKDPDGTPATVGTYTYDALGRRIRKVVTNGGLTGTIPNGTTDCLYSGGGWRCVEERNPLGGGGSTDTPTKQMIWGIYLDELIQQKNLVALNNFDADDELYPLQDLLYRTTGLADDAGVVREAYDCDAYGNTLIFRNAGTPPAVIDFDDADTQVDYATCEFIFTGQRWDAESETYYFKARFYVPQWGRFGQKDSAFQHTNPFSYTNNQATVFVDPAGLWSVRELLLQIVGVHYTGRPVTFSAFSTFFLGLLGPGSVWAAVGGEGTITKCCNSQGGEGWMICGGFVIEGYWALGGSNRDARQMLDRLRNTPLEVMSGGGRTQRQIVNNSSESSFRSRSRSWNIVGSTPPCESGVDVSISGFARASVGAYVGVQGYIKIELFNLDQGFHFGDVTAGLDVATGVWGASFEVGIGGSFSGCMVLTDGEVAAVQHVQQFMSQFKQRYRL